MTDVREVLVTVPRRVGGSMWAKWTYLGAIERGERHISLAILEALARGLECDPKELLQ